MRRISTDSKVIWSVLFWLAYLELQVAHKWFVRDPERQQQQHKCRDDARLAKCGWNGQTIVWRDPAIPDTPARTTPTR